jgi:hypothetical protein
VARGKKAIDASLIADMDLMTLRPQVQSVVDGAPSVLDIMQFARLAEGLVAQSRDFIPVKKRAQIDKAVATTIEHAISITGILKGERLTLLRMQEKEFVTTDDAKSHLAEINFVERHYLKIASQQTLGMFDIVKTAVSKVPQRGRPLGAFSGNNKQDWPLLIAALERLTPERSNQDAHILEIRRVVTEAVEAGQLDHDTRGETSKETIDTHAKRLQSKARRLKGSTSI